MEFVNQTSLPATVQVAESPGPPLRMGYVVAKATYSFDASGDVALDRDDPFPIYYDEQETKLGQLPRDTLARRDEAFEVICLGAAHAPGGRAVEQMTVSLQVGTVKRELLVTGDRSWQGHDDAATTAAPVPFIRMPLTWSRTFGGRADVRIDPDTTIEVAHPLNPFGRGFNPYPAAKSTGEMLASPEGFPTVAGTRPLPNVEDPAHPVVGWDDDPEPNCWATVPLTSGMQALRTLELPPGCDPRQETQTPGVVPLELMAQPRLKDGAYHRAAPCWIIDLPTRGTEVVMGGLTPGGRASFSLPTLDVFVDYVVGQREGTRLLRPQVLVLLPEERRFYLLLKHCFSMEFSSGEERCMRLRQETGWSGGDR